MLQREVDPYRYMRDLLAQTTDRPRQRDAHARIEAVTRRSTRVIGAIITFGPSEAESILGVAALESTAILRFRP
jgi:hypothetical protein